MYPSVLLGLLQQWLNPSLFSSVSCSVLHFIYDLLHPLYPPPKDYFRYTIVFLASMISPASCAFYAAKYTGLPLCLPATFISSCPDACVASEPCQHSELTGHSPKAHALCPPASCLLQALLHVSTTLCPPLLPLISLVPVTTSEPSSVLGFL